MKTPKIVLKDIEWLKPYEQNAKKHSPAQVKKIAASIKLFGWDQPIVADVDGSIIKGHGRRLGAIELDMKQVPVWIRDDLTPDQVRAARLADNRVAIGDVDTEMMQKELDDLMRVPNAVELDQIFDKKELEFYKSNLATMNSDALVMDIDAAVNAQATETSTKIEETDGRDVKIDKVLGFKTIKGKDERHVAMFMAQIEAETGLTAAEAFVDFIKKLMQPAAT